MPDPLNGPAPAAWIITALVLGAFVGVTLWERRAPARNLATIGPRRWVANFGLFAVAYLVPVVVLPLSTAVSGAMGGAWGGVSGGVLDGGLGEVWSQAWTGPAWPIHLPVYGLGVVLALLLLDLTGYLLHRLMHRVPLLWRVHQVHHSDACFDAALSFRFHPLEVALTLVGRQAVGALAGLPEIVLWTDALLVGLHNVWSHANAHLHLGAERWLRPWLVTPDLHRLHHSVRLDESNRNYGILLSVWDRLFGSLHAPARHQPDAVGLSYVDPAQDPDLGALLVMPARRCPDDT